jgi:hypothetical protein
MVILSVVVASCNDDAPTAVRLGPPSLAPRTDIIPVVSADDPRINTNDTWVTQLQTVAETTTVSSTQSFDDPVTGAPVTSVTIGEAPHPNIPDDHLFIIPDGPSHLGETSDKDVAVRVEMILRTGFLVRQVSSTPGPMVF